MSVAAVMKLVQSLRDLQLLDPAQLKQVKADLLTKAVEPVVLINELVGRGWITRYQGEQLREGKEKSLKLGAYSILDRIGEGGMGIVYKARHTFMKRDVALKVIRADLGPAADGFSRFQQEVLAAARVSHPNIVMAHDAGQEGDIAYLVMEYIDGIDLARYLKQYARIDPPDAAEYLRQAAFALQHAHEKGLVHRDIKPSNLLLDKKGETIKLLDLGLAKLRADLGRDSTEGRLTKVNTVMGTPDYIAPEQASDSHSADIRADIYSLGCTGYHMLTGRVPFPVGGLTDKLLAHKQEEPEPITTRCPTAPPGLVQVVQRMMSKRAEHRYQTPAAVALALAPFTRKALRGRDAGTPPSWVVGSENPATEPTVFRPPTAPPMAEPVTPPMAEPVSSEIPMAAAVAAPVAPAGEVVLEEIKPTLSQVGDTMPIPAYSRATSRPSPKSRERIWVIVGGVLVVIGITLAILSGTKKDQSPPETEKKETPSVVGPVTPPKKKEPPSPEALAPWNRDVRDHLAKVLSRGVEHRLTRRIYGEIVDSIDRCNDARWFIGGHWTRDRVPVAVELNSGRLSQRPLTIAEITETRIEPTETSTNAGEKNGLHGGQLLSLDEPQLAVVEEKGRRMVKGRVLCKKVGREPLIDMALAFRRRYAGKDRVHTATTFQQLPDETNVDGWLDVNVELPRTPENGEVKVNPRMELWLIGFAYQPRVGTYQVSNSLPLMLDGVKVVPVHNEPGGWNQEARELVQKLLPEGTNSFAGRRLYTDLVIGFEEGEDVTVRLGAAKAASKRATLLKVVGGKAGPVEELSDERARELQITDTLVNVRTDEGIRLPMQLLATLEKLELRAEQTPAGDRLAGSLLANVLHVQPLTYPNLVFECEGRKGSGEKGDTQGEVIFMRLRHQTTPSGRLEIGVKLPDGFQHIGLSGIVHLEAFQSWPRPGFYQISNSVRFSFGKSSSGNR